MKKTNIGIDIDGVIFDFCNNFKEFANEYHQIPINRMQKQPTKWELYEEWGMDKKQFLEIFEDGVKSDHIFAKGNLLQPTIPRFFQTLRTKQIGIHLISARNVFHCEERILKNTKEWLYKNDIPFDSLILDDKKEKYVHQLGLDFFIEDNIPNAEKIKQVGCSKVFLLNQTWNENYGVKEDIIRIQTLEDIFEHCFD